MNSLKVRKDVISFNLKDKYLRSNHFKSMIQNLQEEVIYNQKSQ
jgi:hypothetical protein